MRQSFYMRRCLFEPKHFSVFRSKTFYMHVVEIRATKDFDALLSLKNTLSSFIVVLL